MPEKLASTKKPLILRIAVVIFFLLLLFVLYRARQVLLPFLIGVFLTYILQPLGRFFMAKKIPLVFIVLIFYLLMTGLFYVVFFLALPSLMVQVSALLESLPEFIDSITDKMDVLLAGFRDINLPESLIEKIQQIPAGWEDSLGEMLTGVTRFLMGSFRYIFALLLAPILSYYMIKEQPSIKKSIVAMLPPAERSEILRIAGDINHIFRSFFTGYLLLALIVGLLSFVVLGLLGVRYSLFLGVIMGLTDLIPYFGPFIGAIPAIVIALLQSPLTAIYTLIAILLIQQIESSVLSPLIIGRRTGLSPLTTIFVVLVGGSFFGILGMIFAVPVSAALKLIIAFIYTRAVSPKSA